MSLTSAAARGTVPRLQLNRLPRIPSHKALLLDSVRAARRRLLALTLLAVAGLGATLVAARAAGAAAPRYVLVVDAGSSGTRMFAYTWRRGAAAGAPPRLEAVSPAAAAHKVPRRALPDKRAYQRVETEPGLDAFAADPDGLRRKALGPLLEWAEAVVPPGQRASTPIFLFGTAGLRKLSEEQQGALLEGCREVLAASAFRFRPVWARIISGADEGVYGWVALNHLQGTLHGGGGSEGGSGAGGTLGALDLGGSSLEVTFAAEAAPEEDAVNATVLGASHQLYAHVHHGYGLNDAFDRAVTLLLARQRQQAAPGHSGTAGGSPDDIARQQQQQEQQQEQQQGAAASAAAADPGSGSGSGLSAAEKAGVAASAADKAAAAGAAEVATAGGRRALLQAPAALRRRLALSARGGEPQPQRERQGQGDEQQADQAPRGDRQLGQADGPPEVAHPCLHAGYRAPYRRRQQDGEAEPDPPQVMLVGRPDFSACEALAREVVAADAPCAAPPCALGAPQPPTKGRRFVALSGFYVVHRFFGLPAGGGAGALRAAARAFCGKSWAAVLAERPGELMLEDYCFRAPYIASLLSEGLLLRDEQLQIGDGSVGWTLGAALVEGHRLGGLGDASSAARWASPGPAWLLLGGASAAFLAVAAAARWQRWPLCGGGASARGGDGGWVALTLGPRYRLESKLSGASSDRSSLGSPSTLYSSSAASTTRSGLSDLIRPPGASPLPTTRSLLGGWASPHPGHPPGAVAAAAPPAQRQQRAGDGGGDVAVSIRSQSWAALGSGPAEDAPAGGSSPVPDDTAAAPLSRLGRSRTYSRRSLAAPNEGEV